MIDLKEIERALKTAEIEVTEFDYEADSGYQVDKKINGFVVFCEGGHFYAKSIFNYTTEFHEQRGIPLAEGATIEQALKAWLRNPKV
jgi:hypothetical protein